jgi:hypothetical protein
MQKVQAVAEQGGQFQQLIYYRIQAMVDMVTISAALLAWRFMAQGVRLVWVAATALIKLGHVAWARARAEVVQVTLQAQPLAATVATAEFQAAAEEEAGLQPMARILAQAAMVGAAKYG